MTIRIPLATSAVFLICLTLLQLPTAQADVRACVPRGFIQMEGGPTVWIDPGTNFPWPHGAVWSRPPWEPYGFWSASVGYDDGCAYAGGMVNLLGNSIAIGEPDTNGDGMGDGWAEHWSDLAGALLQAAMDLDNDGLDNLHEFRWELIPICVPDLIENCLDYDEDMWLDGPEVTYWNNPGNDFALSLPNLSLYDQDRLLNTDGDDRPNAKDADSDDDGLLDGEEITYLSYPEFADSDCEKSAVSCTRSIDTSFFDSSREGNPGTGDGLRDLDELAAWDALGPSTWDTDFDGDGIAPNLLDPDSDNDDLLDSQEFLLGGGQVRPDLQDTDADGIRDGNEPAWNVDSDGDGFVNANDPDSDGDGMPDKWELDHQFNMLDGSDAALDRDGDGLTNLEEYQNGADPNKTDTDLDLLLDGEEVHIHGTSPADWDTDGDGMPDYFEVTYGLNPLSAADATSDPDNDSYSSTTWDNLHEYQYSRPMVYDEATMGPWQGGTNPRNPDTDGDGLTDGHEIDGGTDPRVSETPLSDTDHDGLTFAEESSHGTNPTDPDTDKDQLLDGAEVRVHGTDPTEWDTDGDGIPDSFEVTYQLNPLSAADATGDPDADSYSTTAWDNLHEYQYGRPAGYDEATSGPWKGGTNPRDQDTDDDYASDGYEAHFATNPKVYNPVPKGHVTIHRFPQAGGGLQALTTAPGWTCIDATDGSPVGTSWTPIGAPASVTCTPPVGNPSVCQSVRAVGYHGPVSATIQLTSRCNNGGLSTTATFTGTSNISGQTSRTGRSALTTWTCSVAEPNGFAATDDWWTGCDVNDS